MFTNFVTKPTLSTLTTVAIWSAPLLSFTLLYRLNQKRLQAKAKNNVHYKVLFTSLSDKCINEKHQYKSIMCDTKCSTYFIKNICDFFNSAQHSIIMVMNMLTLEEVAKSILNAHLRGVEIRILCDINKAAVLASKNKELLLHGIPVKTNNNDGSEIHSKFCIVDAGKSTAKMMFGTMNLTMQAIIANQEILIFTDNRIWINMFSKVFDEFWPKWNKY